MSEPSSRPLCSPTVTYVRLHTSCHVASTGCKNTHLYNTPYHLPSSYSCPHGCHHWSRHSLSLPLLLHLNVMQLLCQLGAMVPPEVTAQACHLLRRQAPGSRSGGVSGTAQQTGSSCTATPPQVNTGRASKHRPGIPGNHVLCLQAHGCCADRTCLKHAPGVRLLKHT